MFGDVIRLFIQQWVAKNRIPFSMKRPNAKTKATVSKAHHAQQLEKTSLEQLSEGWDMAAGNSSNHPA